MEIGVLVIIVVIGVAVVMLGGAASMGNMQAQDIAAVASNAGWTGSDLVMAVAVALAESSGNPNAVGDQSLAPTNGPSIGLWQINTGSKAHPELAGQDLTDPQTNANAAYTIWQASGWGAWSTYSNGMASNNFSVASAGVTAMQQASGQTESA